MAESAEGARLLSECTVKSRTEGSNPSLSATGQKGRGHTDIGLFVSNPVWTGMSFYKKFSNLPKQTFNFCGLNGRKAPFVGQKLEYGAQSLPRVIPAVCNLCSFCR